MTDDVDPGYQPWQPTGEPDGVDRAVMAARNALFPLHGLDPHDPRD
jgi:acetoin utilization protein AcuC